MNQVSDNKNRATFWSEDNFVLEQLRLENLYLRQKLNAKAKVRSRQIRRPVKPPCDCGLCMN